MMYEDSSSKGVNADRTFKESVSTRWALLLLLSHTRAHLLSKAHAASKLTSVFLSSPQTIWPLFSN